MSFNQGELVRLKSDASVEGAIVGVLTGGAETRYQVYTGKLGLQTYYESQLESKILEPELLQVDAERFNAALTASLIRNPSLSSLYSLNAGRIDFIPHQFRPVLKFIKADRPRLLIADGVGVGKTIEAGLILREMQARQNLESVLIICPRPLVTERKWESEMKRFDESFVALDGEAFRYCIKETDYEGEWPEKYKKAVLPYSLFDDANVMGTDGQRGRLGLMQLNPPPKFDLVIVDEAHHIRNTSTYAYRAVKEFCDNAEAVIALTATPVQLEYDDLFVLLNLLRPDLIIDKNTFHNMAEPNQYINQAATAIRMQADDWQASALSAIRTACEDTDWGRMVISKNPTALHVIQTLEKPVISAEERVQLITDIESLHTFANIISRTRRRDIGEFTVRKATTVEVEFTPAQRELHDEILAIMHEIFSAIHCTDNTKFMMTTIRRQTASCLFGLVPMLNDILYRHMYELIDDTYADGNAMTDGVDSQEIVARIEQIIALAETLPPDDPKLDQMISIIRDKNADEKNKVMVFSSFKHTLRYLYQKLTAEGLRVGLITGEVPDEQRRELRARFEADRESSSAIDVLLFSEVGCEGLDYQFCDCMINYDLPWNPMRIEQRIGRIDRNGQRSESVSIFNMVTPGTVDYDIYERCTNRIGVFRQSIGDCEEILGSVAKELRDIVENFSLSETEKQARIQQLTDNRIRLLQEQLLLEEKQKDLFSLKVSENSFHKELEGATNYWLSSASLINMVHTYLQARLEQDKEYILGEKALKTLRLSQMARATLLEDFRKCRLPRNAENRAWEKKLQSGDQHIQITFESDCSKENPNAMLISMAHPLIKQAAQYLESTGKQYAVLNVKSHVVQPGEYPFAVYQWKMAGDREDLILQPVSTDTVVNKHIMELLQNSVDCCERIEISPERWDEVEHIHHDMWEQALASHKQRTKELIRYKVGSLTTSHNARMAFLGELLSKASDPKIRQMRESELRNATADYEQHLQDLEQAADKADILFETLAYGILRVAG